MRALEAGCAPVLARMGISTAASIWAASCSKALELRPRSPGDASRRRRAGPARWASRPSPPVSSTSRVGAGRGPGSSSTTPAGRAYRGDGEQHLYAPPIVKAVEDLAARSAADPGRCRLSQRSAT
ncbi:MAG: hypothetical protein R3C32_13370 [Chloroflexota bacterium]